MEHVLFPDLQGFEMVLPSVKLQERVVGEARDTALHMLRANLTGPQR